MKRSIILNLLFFLFASGNAFAYNCDPFQLKSDEYKIEKLLSRSEALSRDADNLAQQAKHPEMTPSQKNEKMDQVVQTRIEALDMVKDANKLKENRDHCAQAAVKAQTSQTSIRSVDSKAAIAQGAN